MYSNVNGTSLNTTYITSIPDTSADPYIFKSADLNGTVFIAVGTIFISLFFLLLLARFWFYLQNRKVAKFGSSFDDYYGNAGHYHDKDEKSISQSNSTTSFLNYDASIFYNNNEKKSGASSPYNNKSSHHGSPSSNSLSTSTGSSNTSLRDTAYIDSQLHENDLSPYISKPGRSFRTALNQQLPPASKRNRNSFISPINELIEQHPEHYNYENSSPSLGNVPVLESPNSSNDKSVSSKSSTRSSPTNKNHRRNKTQSISILMNSSPVMDDHNNSNATASKEDQKRKPHSRSTSLNMYELEKMVNKSLVEVNLSNPSLNTASNVSSKINLSKSTIDQKQESSRARANNSRPPSMVLDMLVQKE